MRKATRLSDVVDIALLCIDHQIQLVIQDSISSVPQVEATIRHFKALSSKCHKSTLCEDRIQKEIDALNAESGSAAINYRKIITPVPTRWNSLCMMLESVISMRKALESIRDFPGKDKADLAKVIPDEEDFDLMEEILPTLTNFKITSESLSADLQPTLHLVVQSLFSLDFDMEKTTSSMDESVAKSFILSLRENLKKRFPDFGTTSMAYAVGSLLHPFYRGAPLSMTNRFDDVFNEIIKKHPSYLDWQQNQEEQRQAGENEDEETLLEEDPLMRASKAYQQPSTSVNGPQKSKIELEFELFLAHPHVKNEKSMNPLEWWKKNSEIFPLLSGIAKKWFCIPASSATSERVFSAGGNIVSYKRTRLEPDNVDKLLYIHQNFSKVKIRNWKLSSDGLDENKEDIVHH